jgi:predicted dehydrogenase
MKAVVIGAGRMGRRHIEAVRRLGLELAGVCDTSPASLELARSEQNVPADLHFADVTAMLDRVRPDCVIVATTAPSHCDYVCRSAEAGARFILVEKPMAVSLAECDRMIETCARHGARLAVNHPTRFLEKLVEAKRLLQSEAFGGFTSMTVVTGNVGMAMNGTHFFEMFRFLAEEPLTEVTAWFSAEAVPNPRGPQYEDRAGSIRIASAGGKRFYMEAGADQGHGVRLIFAGRFGQIAIDDLAGRMSLTCREEAHRGLPTTRYGMPAVNSERAAAPTDVVGTAGAMLDALLSGAAVTSGEDGRRAVEVLVAAYQSAENGNLPVRLGTATLPRDRVFPWA